MTFDWIWYLVSIWCQKGNKWLDLGWIEEKDLELFDILVLDLNVGFIMSSPRDIPSLGGGGGIWNELQSYFPLTRRQSQSRKFESWEENFHWMKPILYLLVFMSFCPIPHPQMGVNAFSKVKSSMNGNIVEGFEINLKFVGNPVERFCPVSTSGQMARLNESSSPGLRLISVAI